MKIESDWKRYWSSSDALKADVAKYGEAAFKREMLYLCANKAQMSYMELVEQVNRQVLLKEEYYNDWIFCKIRKSRNLSASST